MKKHTASNVVKAVYHFLMFFVMVSFLISCCVMLFVTALSETAGIMLTSENLEVAAKLTFGNVLILSLLFTIGDRIRRKLTVDRPIKRITDATDKLMQGDFSVRIEPSPMMPDSSMRSSTA